MTTEIIKFPECATVSDMVLAYDDLINLSGGFIIFGVILGLLLGYLLPQLFGFLFWRLYHYKGWTFLDHRYVRIDD